MSTTFGVKIPLTGEVIPIARRVGIGNGKVSVFFINDLATLLPDNLTVIGIDNSNQGINSIYDLKLASIDKVCCSICDGSGIERVGNQSTKPCGKGCKFS